MGRCGHPSHRPLDAEPWEASQGLEPTCHAAVEWLAATGAAVTLVAWPAHASPVVSTVFATDDAIGRFEELQHGGTLHLCRDRQGDLTHAEVVEGQSWATAALRWVEGISAATPPGPMWPATPSLAFRG